MTTTANFYNIELRDKAGYLKKYLTPWVKNVSWEWNRIGGCGRCQIKLGMDYRNIEFNAGDDMQIRIKTPPSKLNLIPLLTQNSPNTLTGGSASADCAVTGYDADKAVNGLITSADGWVSENTALPHWWKYDLGAGITKTIRRLRLKAFFNAEGCCVKDFTLQGSNNDSSWTTIYTGQHISTKYWADYVFNNLTAYRYYKINITSNWRVDNYAGITEIEMLEVQDTNIASASSEWDDEGSPNYRAYKAMDRDNSTLICWASGYRVNPISTSDPEYLQFEFDAPKRITKYAITSRSIASASPSNWILQGSNDGMLWINLDTRTGEFSGSPAYTTKEYVFQNSSFYRYYRLCITLASDGGGIVCIGEFALYGQERGSKLVYRGWVAKTTPSLKIPQEVTLDIRGYFDKLAFIIIQDSSLKKTYSNQLVSEIVEDIVDTFVAPNSSITKGTIDGASFNVDTIQFKTTIAEALKTLADLEGKIEYGVDENLVFFWRIQGDVMTHKFIIENDIDSFERQIDWSKLMNRIYFEGGDVGGSPYATMVEAPDSQTRYFLAEGIVNNSSITTESVATQYLVAILNEKARPQLILRARIRNTNIRIEDTMPIGRIGIYDKDYDQMLYKWGKTASGGDNLIWGKRAVGGSDAVWGGMFKDQIDKISYALSETEDRFNLEITTGGSAADTPVKVKQLEKLLESVRQNQ